MQQLLVMPAPGTRLRSYDFSPSLVAHPSYLEGVFLRAHEYSGHLFYEVLCDYCNYIGRAGMTVNIPAQLDHHDFQGRLCALDEPHPKLELDVPSQCFYYLDTVWVLSKKNGLWLLFQREHPSSYCWEIHGAQNVEVLWSECVTKIDQHWDPDGR